MSRTPDPTRADVRRARAFAARAYWEGDERTHQHAMRLVWAAEDRRRARRADRLRVLTLMPWWTVPAVLLLGLGAVLLVLAWASAHPVRAGLGVLGAVAFLAWRITVRGRAPHVVQAEEVAPPDVRRTSRPDALSLPMTAEARATHDALDAGRARVYLDALSAGVLPAPTRTRGDGLDVVAVPLPGGRIMPQDVNLRRWAQTLGIEPERVRPGVSVPGFLVVDVLDVAPSALTVGPWPALGGRTRWDEPVQIGCDEVGHAVPLVLAGARVFVCGQSGSGKSRFARMLALHAATDERVALHVLDMKGGPTWLPLRDRAAFFHQGPTTDEVVEHLRALVDDMRDRYRRMSSGEDVIASSGWVVLVADEVQVLWGATSTHARECIALVEEIARQGREAGVGLVLGTHAPDKSSIPQVIADQADVRVMLRTTAPWAVGLVLGDYGVDASSLPPGHAWLNDGSGPRRIVTHYVDDEAARVHVAAVPALPPAPVRAAVLPPATDEDEGRADVLDGDVLGAVLDVIGDRSGIAWADLADALGVDVDDVRGALREHGVTSRSVRVDGTPTRGVRRADVVAAGGLS